MTGTGFIIGLKIDYHGIAALRGRASGTYPTKIDSRSLPPPPFDQTTITAECYRLLHFLPCVTVYGFLNLRPHSAFRLGIAIGSLSRMLFMYWRFASERNRAQYHPQRYAFIVNSCRCLKFFSLF